MKNFLLTKGFIILLFCMFGCAEDQLESPILVFLNPQDIQLEAKSNDRVSITVEATSNNASEIHLMIESVDETYGAKELKDTTFLKSSINYRFEYVVPQYPDSTESLLIFNLSNDLNDAIQIAKKIIVNSGESRVTETSGQMIYSSGSDKPNAFSVSTRSPGFASDSATFEADIVDNTDPAIDGEALSRSWISKTGLSFVQFNGFNYGSATSESIKSAYENGVKLSKISNISDSDIYLIGKGSTALGVIQIIAVTDQPSVQDDKYTFSIKVID